jgi:ABC-2 type transport system permease protein
MKLLSVFLKTLREQWRDRWTLLLMLTLAPFFVFLYWLFFGGGSTRFDVLVLNQDAGIDTTWNAGADLVAALEHDPAVQYEDGQPMLKVHTVSSRQDAETRLKDRDADLLLIVPGDFSAALAAGEDTAITFVGDLTNSYYSVAGVLANAAIASYLGSLDQSASGPPVTITEEALGDSGARTEFETYVPGLLIFAVVMLVFPVAMTVAREIEHGTLRRLQITHMSAFDLLGGISAAQVLVGILAILLTFGVAVALDFESQGPLWVAVLVGAVTGLSVVGVGLVVACFARTVTQASLIANFPLMLMMFFSGSIFPVPGVTLVTIGGRDIGAFDFLPPTHAVVALNKVLTLGEGLGDITYELAAVLVLSVLYFAAGVALFQRLHLRRA